MRKAEAAIARAPGVLQVDCDGQDMRVGLDDGAPRPCPARLEKLPPGKHALAVFAGEQAFATRSVVVEPGSLTSVRVEAPARLRVTANVPEAHVRVGDGPRVELRPDPFLLAAGAYKVRVDATGYVPFSEVVDLGPGITHQLDARLEPVGAKAEGGRGAGPWIMMAAGVAGLGVGVGLNLAHNAKQEQGDQSAADAYIAPSITGYAVGGAALAAGLAWFFWPE